MKKIKDVFSRAYQIEMKYSLGRIITIFFLIHSLNNVKAELLKINIQLQQQKNITNLLIKENKNLRENVVYNYQDYENSPLETWSKKAIKVNGNLRFIGNYFNPAYEKKWGHIFNYDRFNLIGKNNFELGYTKDIAFQYWLNDSLVYATGKVLQKIEHARDSTGETVYFDVLKYRDIRGLGVKKDTFIVGKILRYYD